MINFSTCWLQPNAPVPGISSQALRAWEASYGLTLPLSIKALLVSRNGGEIDRMGTRHAIVPLDQVCPLTERAIHEMLQSNAAAATRAFEGAGVPVLWLIFPICVDEASRWYLLCYPERTRHAVPLLCVWDNGTAYVTTQTPDEFAELLAQATDYPSIDPNETAAMEVVSQEDILCPIDESCILRIQQWLCRQPDHWLHYTRELHTRGSTEVFERRTRALLPTPLKMSGAQVARCRPPVMNFPGSWVLNLESEKNQETVFIDCYRTRAGKWQSEEKHGQPLSALLESISPSRLRHLQGCLSALYPAPRVADTPAAASHSAATSRQFLIQPNPAATAATLRPITDGSMRSARARLSSV